jgi:hypothetical protein
MEFHKESIEETIQASAQIDVESFFQSRVNKDRDYYSFPGGEEPKQKLTAEGITCHLEVLSRKPKPWVLIGKIPTPETWKIPAYLYYGGWNECPMPKEHLAIWHRWNDRYGANIVCATHDVIEGYVDAPPDSDSEAYELARQMYIYCPDIVDQGVQTIDNLASLLRDEGTWYFWWD